MIGKPRTEQYPTAWSYFWAKRAWKRAHGGSIPLRVNGEVVGTITTSGEPDVVDHATAAEAIRRYLDES